MWAGTYGQGLFVFRRDTSAWEQIAPRRGDPAALSWAWVNSIAFARDGSIWYGTVGSISQATGAEFALLPPQNASGNWVKVVQRIPVRIEVPVRPSDPPLRLGMSATVDIDTGYQRSLTDVWQGIARAFGGDAAAGTPQAAKR